MRVTLPRLISIIPRSEVPKHLQGRIISPLSLLNDQPPTWTLIDHLNARKEERAQAYFAAQKSAQESGTLEINAQRWPENLRIEPIVKREAYAKIAKDVRMQLKGALKER